MKAENQKEKKSSDYDPLAIEKKWREKWEQEKIYSPNLDAGKPQGKPFKNQGKPFYNLMMFPYPSAEGLHVGSVFTFTGVDTYGRFKRMQGYSVFEPMGLDGFGIHSENYALKVGRHPKEQAKRSEENFYRQLKAIGNGFDWSRKLETYDPNYYKWTQWIFIQLFKRGLAYRKKAPVNFCPSCKTVLSDEQVIDGKCERCSSVVEKRELEQWFFKITDYAEGLLANIPDLNWTEKVKIAQRDWIGKREGTEIEFRIPFGLAQGGQNSLRPRSGRAEFRIKVFTTRADTLYGATFLVIAPEHPLAASIKDEKVQEYIKAAKKKTEIERGAEGKEKTGIFSGLYAINPLNNEEIPVWIADYALMGFGTGALFGDAHDERDVEFAQKYGIPLKPTIQTGNPEKDARIKNLEECYTGEGVLFDSGEFSGLTSSEAKEKISLWLNKHKKGGPHRTYHLRDWLISRQRYWGPPIPMIYCQSCAQKGLSWFTQNGKVSKVSKVSNRVPFDTSGTFDTSWSAGWFAVSEDQLPVLLPDVEDWRPEGTGTSPLANHPEFYKTTCPQCGGEARRETDVSDVFLDSTWYFFRYLSTEFKDVAFDKERAKNWLPVTMYIGGAEHSVLHLLYSRFITMVFKDMGLISFEEPYARFYAHGLIIKDGAKMSKSKGNVINPDEYLAKYGVDTLRAYLRFVGPFDMGGDFRDSGIEGMERFMKRVWKLVQESSIKYQVVSSKDETNEIKDAEAKLNQAMHKAIKAVTEDLENLRFNTGIAHIMEYYNCLSDYYTKYHILDTIYCKTLVLLLAPFTPFIAEELWEYIGESFSVHITEWPQYDPAVLQEQKVTIAVQINGKTRHTITIDRQNSKNKTDIEKIVRQEEKVKKYLDGKNIKKTIYIEAKILNFVTDRQDS